MLMYSDFKTPAHAVKTLRMLRKNGSFQAPQFLYPRFYSAILSGMILFRYTKKKVSRPYHMEVNLATSEDPSYSHCLNLVKIFDKYYYGVE
ncbi:hypothetical protein [Sigmofec virus UA08Rod_4138]|uniref:Uncharacterized protein n=1 Tax=Sigmofec virus UA08Rod_4138 TaxID=2929396 RepID=A0A976N169_9VIRU|nr:hypothetical protein [Sigmofec virus UA08Rod_4138]